MCEILESTASSESNESNAPYMCVCMCMYACTYVVCLYACMHACNLYGVCMNEYVYLCICVCMYVCK